MSEAKTRRILVTRPQPAADDFADKLRREGFEVFVAPMTEYVEIDSDIGDLAPYQGIIFTSAQGLNIFARRFIDRYIPVFCVGDSTAQAADKAGFRRVYSAQGDAQALAALIKQRKDVHELKQMLHVCGEDTAEDFGDLLKPEGIYVTRAPVYKAKYIESLPLPVIQALQEGDITTVTLFSARTAENFARIIEETEDLKGVSNDLEAVCLSDRVAAEVKYLPWRAVRVANTPQIETVMDILRQKEEGRSEYAPLAADRVIDAFGGLRPLANKLDITASTVQGWKKRGIIPETRVDAVLKAANEAGINPDLLWKEEGKGAMTDSSDGKTGKSTAGTAGATGAPPPPKTAAAPSERRRGPDRREKYTAPDQRGFISHDKYSGPERRVGVDRRSYQERQAGRIAAEKWKFLNRSFLMTGFFLGCGLYGAGLMLAPEVFQFGHKTDNVAAMQAQVDDLNARILALQKARQGEIEGLETKLNEKVDKKMTEQEQSFGQQIYNKLGEIENATKQVREMTGTVGDVAAKATGAVGDAVVEAANKTEVGRDLTSFLRVLNNISAQSKTKEGQSSMGRAYDKLRETLALAPTDAAGLNAAMAKSLKGDKDLQALLGNIDVRDLGAAGLLLALNEFRNNVNTHQSFEQDLLIMQKFLGDDPKMKKALDRLSPYAQNGVLNRRQLQEEFSGLASDIVMAKLQGQDLSVKQEMLKRLGKLVKVRKIDDVQGPSVDAKVARAQILLNKGDVKGAMRELQTLEGAPAQVAAPFMDKAAGNVMAEDTESKLLDTVMDQFQPGSTALDSANLNSLFEDVWNQGPNGLMPYLTGGQRNTKITSPYVGPQVIDPMTPPGSSGGDATAIPITPVPSGGFDDGGSSGGGE